ncbi:MAG: amidohydrolase family protein [Deltaproteobacteria bacterium]|nr:amidohydrolase family protein [Deltaproteobacteria bacterium]
MRFTIACCLAAALGATGCTTDNTGDEPDSSLQVDADVPDVDGGPGTDGSVSSDGGTSIPPATITPGAADRFLFVGTVLTPTGPMAGEVLVEGVRITCVAASCSAMPGATGATVVRTSGVISPGLVETHNHGLFNIFDEADWNPGRFYQNHNNWTSDTRYGQVVDAKQYLNGEGSPVDFTCELDKYAEVKALISGTTSYLLAPGAQEPACYDSVIRTIDTQRNDLGFDRIRTSISVPDNAGAVSVCNGFTAGTTTSYVVHVGEGVDGTALNEFATLSGRNGGCLLSPHTTIVHGTAFGMPQFTQMAMSGMRLVWSPKSNLFLYDGAAKLDLAIAAGVSVIALGPDWSLGGSINLLDELRTADMVDTMRLGNILTPRRLYDMVTIDAARALSLEAEVGSLAVGKRADIALYAADPADPYTAMLGQRPQTVELVMVDGRVLYGDRALKAAGPAAPGCEDIDICGVPKFLCIAETSTLNKLNQTFAEVVTALNGAMQAYDAMFPAQAPMFPLAPLTRCN